MTELRGKSNGDGLVPIEVAVECPRGDWHLPVVVFTRRLRDRFRRRYWVRCWACNMRIGPCRTRDEAEATRSDVEGIGGVRAVLKREGIKVWDWDSTP